MIATVINFCSNDAVFLKPCIEAVKPFSKQILLSVCDHFFDGTPENRPLLESLYQQYSEVQFIEYAFDLQRSFYGTHSTHFWHNMGRLLGFAFLKKEISHILFIDVDEIVETPSFQKWLETAVYREFDAMRLACYWYFRDPCYQAKTWEDTPLLVRRSAINYDALMHPEERAGTFSHIQGNKQRFVLDTSAKPMIHHYSWVRTKEQMLRKVETWGHREERNWKSLVHREFSLPFIGRDFVHGYEFIEVDPKIVFEEISLKENKNVEKKHVQVLTTRQINQIDLSLKFEL